MANNTRFEDWYDEITASLVAISTHVQDYQLAFLLNKELGVSLKRKPENYNLNERGAKFEYSIFVSEQFKQIPLCYLIQNQSKTSHSGTGNDSLFTAFNGLSMPLLKKHAKHDYFLISEDRSWLLAQIHSIRNNLISYAYLVDNKDLNKHEQTILTNIYYEN